MAIDSTRSTISAPSSLLRLTAASSALPSGQPLEAKVVRAEGGSVTIAVAGRLLEAQTTLRLVAGMVLAVRVEEENGQQLLRIVAPEEPEQRTAEQAVRQALPRQAPLGELFQRIANPTPTASESETATRPPLPQPAANATTSPATTSGQTVATSSSPSTPPAATQLAAPLLRILPSIAQLSSADGLRQALLNSGLFMEQKLAQGDSAGLRSDLKANLLRMVQQLLVHGGAKEGSAVQRTDSAPDLAPELLQLLKDGEAALARIQLHQLAALPRSEGPEPQWLFELPLRLPQQEPEVLRIRIQHEQRNNGNGKGPCWSVTLEMSDAQQQPLRGVVTYQGGTISTTFWAAQPATAELLRSRLDELHGRLVAQGLEVGRLGCFAGQPPDHKSIEKLSSGLLREKA